MQKISLLALALLAASFAQAVSVYECTVNGNRVYTQNPSANCKKSDLGKPSGYTSAPVQYTPPAAKTNAGTDKDRSETEAKQKLDQAKQALEDGKNVRLGNERNYSKYQERIRSLEQNVEAAEKALKDKDTSIPLPQ
ncbi:DUF4124 domain-containing protein [Neisseria weaveri]|uniref:Periplasmic protein n=1 Tax=Neisseria weaveri TaxID=28091 RepID=A0A3S4YT21_9NEIS|nr:DUF4124 domain-containing protein [Neisseria weaveri]EGV34681.1 hypothetical protein l13_19400 [Neisseria weaveri ATCC 51223]EGV35817.1 hypothetical protein l11_19670 [Neisseria weaveri LMG 5135]SAY50614.1 Periplasmic protein [Neisseria weaveri]VEJ52026.1 Periplasmic protein [Neisseria weaveri]